MSENPFRNTPTSLETLAHLHSGRLQSMITETILQQFNINCTAHIHSKTPPHHDQPLVYNIRINQQGGEPTTAQLCQIFTNKMRPAYTALVDNQGNLPFIFSRFTQNDDNSVTITCIFTPSFIMRLQLEFPHIYRIITVVTHILPSKKQ